MANERVVLAYSGGLDTSVAIGWMKEKLGVDTIAVSVDVGQGGEDLEVIRQRALDCGAVEAYVADAKDEFANEYCMPALLANGMYEGQYPLVSALSRPLISKHLVMETTKQNPFSIDQNVWGRAIETGFLEDLWNAPTKDVYNYTDDPGFAGVPDEVVISFERGLPVALDGVKLTPLQIIQEMNRRAGAQGIGRIDMVEDRLVGIKSREIYEAPGAVALIRAHQALEELCLERMQLRFKRQQIEPIWADLVYEAQWNSPLKKSLDAFVAQTQEYVTGEIRMEMHGGRATVNGRRSESSLYDFSLATYDSGDTFNQAAARGFIEIYGMQSRLAAARDVKFGKGIELEASKL